MHVCLKVNTNKFKTERNGKFKTLEHFNISSTNHINNIIFPFLKMYLWRKYIIKCMTLRKCLFVV